MSNTTIKASPTKEFFIHMLTRDVLITRAILDLVDNSVDGARRLKPDDNYSGLRVSIQFSADEFRIEDNCGGIPVDIARDYAFRFGRPKNAPNTTASSVGQFGVGMKRTFFKLGRYFSVRSNTSTSRFEMAVDVDDWLNQPGDTESWHFEFKSIEENIEVPAAEVGTRISVTRLLDEPKSSFSQNSFTRELQQGISEGHALVLAKGLEISLNGLHLSHHPLDLLRSSEIIPAYVERTFYENDAHPVKTRIYVGVSQREKDDGGWYIFCNGRMVVRADQSVLTGWGEGEGTTMPKYHPDFAFFRGYVFFDCEDAAKLPWTTTKTGVDADSWLFRAVREEMIQIAKPVLKFLREMTNERAEVAAGDRTVSTLEKAWKTATPSQLPSLAATATFVAPRPSQITGPRMQKIQYSKPADEVEEVKVALGARSFTDVGLRTFEYYREYELGKE